MIAGKALSLYLRPTQYVDCDAPAVRELAQRLLGAASGDSPQARAIALFEGVRDGIRYDPYQISFNADDYRASHVVQQAANWCVPKAILLTALARAAGIPAVTGFADVCNHLNSPKLRDLMGTDLFIYHGYTAMWLSGHLVKVTPAFNTELCERFGVRPLVFDGRGDALFHEMDVMNRPHIDYVRDRGIFADPPIETLLKEMAANYPNLAEFIRTQRQTAIEDATFHDQSGAAGTDCRRTGKTS